MSGEGSTDGVGRYVAAELASAGRSNREIAGELFVTKATVETHLRSVFGKLDVRSRDEIGNRLDSGSLPARVG